ncbi:outer membrane beta-barrel protein [Halpernia frigidisoli]|uniref:Outer membrane receptor proteins, mostly Fe transport n=1 Tax=Halpernia frigidisoli TaxID=1125876 RepID=A0A1I3I4D5_9FLAO|nr:outer membrane beta-barrel protein [Halpernia frigidisoli]SFI42720.1 Outer membrane receptor proteins, mostly Fe transport [Halpernia frigidisoli]
MKKHLLIFSILCSVVVFSQEKPAENKEKNIEEVTITKVKKAVEQKADRTIFDFSEQPNLNSGTVMEGMKKLPGLIVSDVAGMLYQGKQLDVYLDGRPLNISSNELNAFLEGLPANSVDRIEIITQPGAEFPATSGGAILNIITGKNSNKYLTATYSGNYNFTNYDKFRSRTNNSISLNARNNIFGWQINAGQNYREGLNTSNQDNLAFINSDPVNRGYFLKTALTFDLGKDRLLLNYDFYNNSGDTENISSGTSKGIPYIQNALLQSESYRNEGVITYQKRFTDKAKKLDFKGTYTRGDSQFNQLDQNLSQTVLDNSSITKIANFRIDYSQPLKILDDGKISFGTLYDQQNFKTAGFNFLNLDYQKLNAAGYLEFQATLKNIDLILGTRGENYDISGTAYNGSTKRYEDLTGFKKFKLFPNASLQYNFAKQVFFALNYNKKISLPSISVLNPNNTTFQGPNSQSTGNPNLQPTIYDNYEVKLSAVDYVFIGYNLSVAKNQVVQKLSRITDLKTNTDVVINSQDNVSELKIHNFNVGFPVPFLIFNTPFSELMKFNINPDNVSYVYIYAAYQLHELPNISTKGFWVFNFNSQIILPKKIKFVASYNYLTPNGNYYYFVGDKPFSNSLDLNLSRKFMNDRLSVSLFANDIFNTQQTALHSISSLPFVYLSSKSDTRNFGFSLNYKIPTKNKNAKVDQNLLEKDKKDDGGLIPVQ